MLQASTITNTVRVNEDPRTATIRNLRAHIEFLEKQLLVDSSVLAASYVCTRCNTPGPRFRGNPASHAHATACYTIQSSKSGGEEKLRISDISENDIVCDGHGMASLPDEHLSRTYQPQASDTTLNSTCGSHTASIQQVEPTENGGKRQHSDEPSAALDSVLVAAMSTTECAPRDAGVLDSDVPLDKIQVQTLVSKLLQYASLTQGLKTTVSNLYEANKEFRTQYFECTKTLEKLRQEGNALQTENAELRGVSGMLSSVVSVCCPSS